MRRLRQILILRKLRIPLKQIGAVFNKAEANFAIEVCQQNIDELQGEIDAITIIKGLLQSLITRLHESENVNIDSCLLDDEAITSIINRITLSKIKFKEEPLMDEFSRASEHLSKLKDSDVRIIFLPPSPVAAYHVLKAEPEQEAMETINQFVKEYRLKTIKPDVRCYGFNNPSPSSDSAIYGYEVWVTIPDCMDIPTHLVKKKFEGGLYAAHTIQMGDFIQWDWLFGWVSNNKDYTFNGQHCLEECLNYYNHVDKDTDDVQLDLLIAIKERQ